VFSCLALLCFIISFGITYVRDLYGFPSPPTPAQRYFALWMGLAESMEWMDGWAEGSLVSRGVSDGLCFIGDSSSFFF